jgi:hypothetical protein
MATSVKMSEAAKRRVDRMREEFGRIEGRTITVQEVLDALAEAGEEHRDLILSKISGIKYPVPRSTMRASMALVADLGPTSEEDIDRTLYGGRRRRRS